MDDESSYEHAVVESEVDPDEPGTELPKKTATRRWGPLGKALTVVVSAASLVTGVISVWPILFANASAYSSLVLTAETYSGVHSEFAVPADTDFESFPTSDEACSPGQLEWLDTYGSPLLRHIMLDLRNVAEEGPMIALTDFHATADEESTSSGEKTSHIRVVCDPSGGSSPVQAARLDVGSPDAVAAYPPSAFGMNDAATPDAPVAWNLAPGEAGLIILEFFSDIEVHGVISLTAHIGKESREISIDGSEFQTPPLVDSGYRHLVVTREGFECRDVKGNLCGIMDIVK